MVSSVASRRDYAGGTWPRAMVVDEDTIEHAPHLARGAGEVAAPSRGG